MIKILLIDDETPLLEISSIFLMKSGDINVETAASAREALEKIQNCLYDAIVSDYEMPGMDGIELLKHLRSTANTTPFILFTGRGREDVVIEALNNGATFYLQKGGESKLQFAELASKIHQAVKHSRAECAAKEYHQQLEDILNFLPDPTIAIDVNGKLIAWNRATEEMTGVHAGEVIGKGNYQYAIPFCRKRCPLLMNLILHPEENILTTHYRIQMREKNILIGECQTEMPSGETRVLSIKATLLYNGEGKITGAIESICDITTRERVETALRQANRQLNLLSNITRHDILNQISALRGYLELSQSLLHDPDALKKFLEKEKRAVATIEHQVKFTKVYQDHGSQDPQWQELDRLLPRPHVPASITFTADVQGILIFADPILEKVFFNFLDNSIRHGQHVKEIRVSSSQSDEGLTVVWEDNGTGIAADEKEKIFKRGIGTNNGLGLFLVREILSLTGIAIKETGTQGKGARFEMNVPKGYYRLTKKLGQHDVQSCKSGEPKQFPQKAG